jgi:hypothetical protein
VSVNHGRPMRSGEERFVNFTLSGLIPENSSLILDTEKGQLLLLAPKPGTTVWTVVESQTFTYLEYRCLRPLLGFYPYYTPYHLLLKAFHGGSEQRWEQMVLEAVESGTLNTLMHTLRNVLTRVRVKSRRFMIEISSMVATGYCLRPYTKAEPASPL